MFMNKKKLKLSIIASIIINSTYSYALNKPSDLILTKDIKFEFESVDKNSLRGYDSNRQIHGRMEYRNLPIILASKYQNIIITSDKDNINISHDIGKSFTPLKIENFNNVRALSLSENGRYLTAHGEYNNNPVFFVYDVFSKETNLFNHKSDISYYIEDDYYFTTNDGLFSLYSEDNEPYTRYASPSEKNFFIFDNENKKSIPLNEWNKTKLNNHIEKNKFIAFEKLTSFNNLIKLKPKITAPSFSGKYLYGTLKRENQKSDNVRLAFLYDQSNDDVKIISNSDYGSSRINQLSKNDIAVGWIESRIKRKNESDDRLIREAFIYDPTQNKIRKPIINSTNSNHYYNSEATAISENGEFFVGWVEYGGNIVKKRQASPLSEYPRNAFVYFVDEEKSQLLLNLNNNIEESEAYSISRDGNAIFGVSKGSNNDWKLVAWNIEKTPKNKIEENQNKEAINIKYDTLLATNDIEKTKVHSKLSFEKFTSLKKPFDTQEKALFNKLETTKTDMENTIKERIRIEKIIDYGDRNGGSETYDKYSDEYNTYKNKEDDYKKEIEDINHEITNLNNGTQGSQLKLAEYEYAKSQTTLNALTQKNAAIEAEKVKEKQRLADEAREQQRLAEEKQRLADEAREQQRLAEEAKEKQRLADEAREQQRLAEEAKEKQRLADKAREQQRLTEEAKEKQRLADKAREQQCLAEEAKEKQRLADEAKEQQRLAEEKAKTDAKTKELIPVEDERAQRAKEKAKEKETTKPSIVISKPIDIENTYKSMQLMAENDYKLLDMQQGQLRYLASATCSVGTEKACISGFAHHQNINKANATQTGLSGAYRFDVNHIPLIVGLAIDTDVYSSLPKGYQYQGYALPLIGFSLDLMPSLNAELNSNALHLSLKGAYLNRKVSIERQALENTEAGKGNAKISAYHIELKGYYPYSIADDLLLTPFAGLTFNQISRSAYSETQNAQFAAHYDALKTHSLLAKMGLGIDYLLGSSFILNTKAGLLWNLSHHQGDFRSHIDYLGQQHIDYSENKKQLKQRPFAKLGLTYQLDKQSSINTSADWEMTPYRNHDMQFGVSYTYRF
ncbi:autotransporter domain-containing protein [Proteus faecis]|uniref:autotransporter domain-containing protein n=1 Tax=Proteus faecis TaxID=2050967 RepID=UPI0021BA555F|nr:autotransporter domain-containing protein [Proteus faecis]MCT8250777.1 autotransporter domain-containing protein [Proteus faecis]